uniref:hypothetical protein n=1 Tax=Vibrio cholerae TaxID=666 RepID=UPI003F583B81
MKIDINNTFLHKENILNNHDSSSSPISILDIDSAEKKIDDINQDDSLISILENKEKQ